MAERRRRLGSIRARTTMLAAVAFGAALLVASYALIAVQRSSLTDNVDDSLLLRATDIVTVIETTGVPEALGGDPGDDAIVAVINADELEVLVTSDELLDPERLLELAEPEAGPGTGRLDRISGDRQGGRFRVLGVPALFEEVIDEDEFGEPTEVELVEHVVYVAASLDAVDETIADLTRTLAIGAPGLLLVVAALVWLVTGRALRPVEAIRTQVDQITALDLHRRVPVPGSADEIGRLAGTMNSMLDRLEESSRRQSQFVSDASHELRSPLTGMSATLDVALTHPSAVDWPKTAGEVLDEAARMRRLVDDLLLLARADEGRLRRVRRPVDLDDVVLRERAACVAPAGRSIDASRVSAGLVLGDQTQLGRVVRNLIDNAVRHASTEVTLRLHQDGDRVRLEVADDGAGLDPEERDHIFERFVRLDAARSRDQGGSGLGLAISQEIIHHHDGSIWVEDAADGGARFVVDLPRHQAGGPLPDF